MRSLVMLVRFGSLFIFGSKFTSSAAGLLWASGKIIDCRLVAGALGAGTAGGAVGTTERVVDGPPTVDARTSATTVPPGPTKK